MKLDGVTFVAELNHESIVLGPRIRVNTELKFHLTGITEQIYNYDEIKNGDGVVSHLSLNSIFVYFV